MRKIDTKIGDRFKNLDGHVAEVLSIKSALDIVVKFVGYNREISFRNNHLKTGNFKNRDAISVYGVGHIGFGKYKAGTMCYKKWQSMLQRCYDPSFQERNPQYMGCTVNSEWHNFQNFAEWFNSQYCEHLWELDKDLLYKGNKIYSKENCCLVPKEINNLILTNNKSRGSLPIGVTWHKKRQVYVAQCTYHDNGVRKNKWLYEGSSPEVAFSAYKNFKEGIFKLCAEKYVDKISKSAYRALLERVVDFND